MIETLQRPSSPRRRVSKPAPDLLPFLEALHSRYHRPDMIRRDPLHWPREYSSRADREIAAFLASSLAYGNVLQIDRSLADLFRRLGRSPAAFARDFVPGKSDAALDGFYHRFNTSRDLAALLHLLGQILRSHASLENFWLASNEAQTEAVGRLSRADSSSGLQNPSALESRPTAATPNKLASTSPAANALPSPFALRSSHFISDRAARFIHAALNLDLSDYFPRGASQTAADKDSPRLSFLYLLPLAAGPSACKRLNMFLRWVVRPDDGIDLGLWRAESPADLEYPVDMHIHRIASYLGATRRKTADARARREITDFFRRLRPDDPVRYDFSLCRLGILRACPRKNDPAICGQCELRAGCSRHQRMLKGK